MFNSYVKLPEGNPVTRLPQDVPGQFRRQSLQAGRGKSWGAGFSVHKGLCLKSWGIPSRHHGCETILSQYTKSLG